MTHRADAALARLTARLIRRGTLLLALAAVAYLALETFTYRHTYPDAAARARIATFQDNPAVRMIQGIPHAVDTPGGFVAWDGGWAMAAVIAIWALLTTGRLLRGEEDTGRAELLLAAPLTAGRATLAQLTTVIAANAAIGATVTATLTAAGTGLPGSALFGSAIAAFGATFAALTAVATQILDIRRRATAATAAALAAAFMLRMAANSTGSRGGLRWLTPFGWLDELHPYRDPRWTALIPLLAAPAVLTAAAVLLRRARDTGGALLTGPDRRPARPHLLGGPAAFAWRTTQGLLTGWLAGIAVFAFVIGAVAKSVTDFMTTDPHYRRVLRSLGWNAAQAITGYTGIMAAFIGLLLALYGCWRIGAARAEEAAGRLEHTLARPVTRHRWLTGHLLWTATSLTLLTVCAALTERLGVTAGGADLTVADALGSAFNTLPLVALYTGLAVLTYGLRPRLTVVLPVTAAITGYLVETLGSTLDWPAAVMDLSPFHHLATVPSEPFAAGPAAVMAVLGALATAAGLLLFGRRDITGD